MKIYTYIPAASELTIPYYTFTQVKLKSVLHVCRIKHEVIYIECRFTQLFLQCILRMMMTPNRNNYIQSNIYTGELGYDRLNGTRNIGPSYAKSVINT